MAIRSDEITSIIRNEIKGFDAGRAAGEAPALDDQLVLGVLRRDAVDHAAHGAKRQQELHDRDQEHHERDHRQADRPDGDREAARDAVVIASWWIIIASAPPAHRALTTACTSC